MRELIKAGLVALVLSLCLAAPVAAGPLEDATAALNRGDYPTALRLIRPLAEQGNAQAQSDLGFMYAQARGVPQDYVEAEKWLRKAAEENNVAAQYNLAGMYKDGVGVTRNYAEAAKWFRKAADQGYPYAQLNLGLLYKDGQGVTKDHVQAYKWLDLGWASLDAAIAMGEVHYDDVIADEDGAKKDRDSVAQLMTPDQIAEAQRLASEWKPSNP